MTIASRPITDHWWKSPFRLLQTNLRESDAALEAVPAVDKVVVLGYDTWLCNAGGIVYFYPVDADYQRMAPALEKRLSKDLVGDVIEAAHARSVRLLARFDFSRLPTEIIADNPGWAFIDSQDEWYSEDGLTAICPRSDYYEHVVPEVLVDFVTRYAIDGIFFNWLQYPEVSYSMRYKGVCQCLRCKAAFQAGFPGEEHPRAMGDPGYQDWLTVAGARLTELTTRYSRLINEVRPGTPMMLADVKMDVAFLETNSFLPNHGAGPWWHHTPSEQASMNLVSYPDKPALVHSSVNVGLPYRQIAEQPSQFRRYVAQALSRGALPSVVVIGQVDTLRFPCLTAATELLEFHARHHDLYAAYRSTSDVAILRPGGGTGMASVQGQGEVTEYRGLYTALQESHIPFDVLGVQYQHSIAEDHTLAHYKVVVVPGTDGFERPLLDALDAFVEAGGSLVLTGNAFDSDGESSLRSAPAIRRTDLINDVMQLGGRYVGPVSGESIGPVLPAMGHFSIVDCRTGSELGHYALSTQTPFGPPEISGGNEPDSAVPAIIRGRFGNGRVTQFPWSIGRSAHESGLKAIDLLLIEELNALSTDALQVSGEFPSDIEVTLGKSGSTWVIHLVNHSGGRSDRVRDPIPIAGRILLSSALTETLTTCRAELAGTFLTIERDTTGAAHIDVRVDGVLEVVTLA